MKKKFIPIKPKYKRLDECPPEYANLAISHMDAGEGVFFARELEHIKAKTYDKKWPTLKARNVLPLEFEANAGATTITYRQYDQVGMAKIISNFADDLPRADVRGREFNSPVRELADAYGYNIKEINSSKMTGKPLEARRGTAAKRAAYVLENKIAFSGDTEHNLGGFFNNPNISEVTLAADGSGNSKAFSTKTPDQMIRDLNRLPTLVRTQSKGIETADSMLLPISLWNLLGTTRLPNTGISVRKWFLDNSPHIKKIDWVDELSTAGSGGGSRIIVYRYDPEALTLEIPQDFTQLPVQQRNLEFEVPCWMSTGGVLIYYPLSIAFADGA